MERVMPDDSLHHQIKERIRAEFLGGPMAAPEDRLPSERELQARYGVSRPTISRALAALAAEGLIVNRPKRGYFRLVTPASRLTAAETRLIGYVGPLAGEELVQRAFRGIDRVAHRRGYRVLMGSAGNDVEREQGAVFDLIASGARGVIITPFPRVGEVERVTDYLFTEQFGVPLALLDTCVPEQGHLQVIFDNRRAGYALTSWLISAGRRRIGVMSFIEEIRHAPLLHRLQGYQDALRDHKIAFDPDLVRRYDNRYLASEAMGAILENWLQRPEPPDAIIAVDDMAAMEIIEQLTARRVAVPDQITVVGFDNRAAARRFHPAFPTTNPDFQRLGEMACELLIEGLETGNLMPRTLMLEVPLLIRRDTQPSLAAHSEPAASRRER
jgi:DNA-binding LacI/PurR family transcriptional regulator